MKTDREIMSLKDLFGKLLRREDLHPSEAACAMEHLVSGAVTHAQVASFLTALRMKGETVPEITAFARVLRDKAERVEIGVDAVDIVGTGGDGTHTFNISTAAAFVAAAAGAPVAKHGNRASSSLCGTADVLEALGSDLSRSSERAAACIEGTGICFLFAQNAHRCMRHVAQPRREMGIRTVFNLIGPLANPAFVKRQLMGVPTDEWVIPMAQVLVNLGMTHAMVVHGEDGPDEITLGGSTLVAEVRAGEVHTYRIAPEEFGFDRQPITTLRGGDAQENAGILLGILQGDEGPKRDVVLLNAGAALYVAGCCNSMAEGVELARKAIDEGAALKILRAFLAETAAAAPMVGRGYAGGMLP